MLQPKTLSWVHPVLAAMFPVIFLYSQSIGETPFTTAVAPMLLMLGIAAVLMLSLRLVLRDAVKAGFLASILLLLFFSHGHVFGMIEQNTIAGFVIGRQRYLLLAEVGAAAAALFVVLRARKISYNLTPYFTAGLAMLVGINAVIIVQHHLNSSPVKAFEVYGREYIPSVSMQRERMPDIYYIILDGYARGDVLRDIYEFDNTGFLDHLTNNGFYVAKESRANYVTTQLSLASSLNMTHVDILAQTMGADSNDSAILRRMIRDNAVSRITKSLGYRFVFLPSTFGPTRWNPNADAQFRPELYPFGRVGKLFIGPIMDNDLGSALLHYSSLWPIADKWILANSASLFVKNLEQLTKIPALEGPTFTFAHFLPPHPPYIFDQDGNARGKKYTLTYWFDKQSYLDQLVWVNKSMERVVDQILEQSKDSAVIIIQSDHGSRSSDTREVIAFGGPPDRTLVWERSSILNAYHLPDMCKSSDLYPSITPVNTFRLIFNSCLGANFEYLEDKTYWSSHERPYDFTEIEKLVLAAGNS